ncbi:MAG TPA: fibronectin type III domain-containing protein, partial [Planctomycetota bacterium]
MSRSLRLLTPAALALILAATFYLTRGAPAPPPAAPPPRPEVKAAPEPLRLERTSAPASPARTKGRVDGRRPFLPPTPPLARPTPIPGRVTVSHGTEPLRPTFPLHREGVLHERDGQFGHVTENYGATLDAKGLLLGAHRDYEGIGQPLLAFTFQEARMGGRVLASAGDLAPAARPEDRSVVYARPGIEERYQLLKEGVEQFFVLRELPEPRDAIVVTGAIETNVETPADGTLSSELVFPHAGNGGFTVSNAVAIDAEGRRIDLLLAFAEGRMSMTIPADWAREATAPITIDPLFGAAFTIDAYAIDPWFWSHNVVYGDALNEWLFVWNERTGADGGKNDMFAQRIGADGTLVGPAIQVTFAQANVSDPGVMWIGGGVNRYLLVWNEADGTGYARVMGRLMNADGTWFSASAFVIKDTPGNVFDRWPQVSTDGAGFFVAYTTDTLNTSTFQWEGSMRGRTLSATGAVGAELLIDSFPAHYVRPRISFTSGAYLVLYGRAYLGSNQYGLFGRTLNASGTPISAVMNPGAAQIGMYDVSGGNGRFLITWPESGTWRLFAETVDTSFATVAGPELIDQGTTDWAHSAAPVWVPAANEWFVPYIGPNTTYELWARRVGFNGLLGSMERLTNTVESEMLPRASLNPATQHVLIAYVQNTVDPFLFRGLRYAVAAPPPPTGFAGTATSASAVQWSWTNPAGEVSSELHDDLHGVKGTPAANVTSFSETGLAENTPYTRHLHTVTAAGLSGPSNAVTRYTLTRTAAAADLVLTADSASQITAAAAAPANPTSGSSGCEIQRSPDNATWATVKAFSNVYSHASTGLAASTTYWFRVRYRNGDGVATAYSPSKSIATTPAALTGFAGGAQSVSAILWSWANAAGETGYQVHDDVHAVKGSTGVDVLSFSETGLLENTPYSRHAHALNAGGAGAPSATLVRFTRAHDPASGDVTVAVISGTQIDVAVAVPPNPSLGTTGCEIQRSPDNVTWATVKAFSNVYAFSNTGLTANTLYYFRVRYRNGDSVATAYSAVKSARTLTPAAPASFAGTAASTTSIGWTWANVADESGFQVHEAGEAVKGKTGVDGLAFTETGLFENTAYARHVHAVNGSLLSAASAAATVYTRVHDPLVGDFAPKVISGTQIDVAVLPPPNGTS